MLLLSGEIIVKQLTGTQRVGAGLLTNFGLINFVYICNNKYAVWDLH